MANSLTREAIYPHEEWQVSESTFDYENNFRDETVFAVGNGLIGVRGGFEEGYGGPIGTGGDATFLNGFYESGIVQHAEPAYGLASVRQTLLNVTDAKVVRLRVDGEDFVMRPDNVRHYFRKLDFRTGQMTRRVIWRTESGKELRIRTSRLVSFNRKRLYACSYEVTALNFSGVVEILSGMDADVHNRRSLNDPRVGSFFSGHALEVEGKSQHGELFALQVRTKASKFALVTGMLNRITEGEVQSRIVEENDRFIGERFAIHLSEGGSTRLEKYVSYFHSKHELEDVLGSLAENEVRSAAEVGFAAVAKEQEDYLTEFWANANVEILGDVPLVQGLRFNLFHLLQSVGRDGKTNIAAKGVVGEGYEGHYFWDTEVFILPVFLHTKPYLARALLEHRYSILEKSRQRANELSIKGALYAWRTIDGEELSAYFPAGTAQYHINADIALAIKQYYLATADREFMYEKGVEMLFETARAWISIGDYIPGRGFCLNCVTGPDEYTALVNNNTYTNIMAKDHLEFAVAMAKEMQSQAPREFQRVKRKLGLDDVEFGEWARAAGEMYIHRDEQKGLIGQDDSFLMKGRWDFKSLPQEKHPFNMNFHYLHIYRYQVLKQADLIQAMFVQGNRFTRLEKVRAYDYYEPITSHDSSLSLCVHSILAGEIGYKKQAYEYYVGTVRVDLDDLHHNVRDGIHAAAMAGSWLGLAYGFGGAREFNGKLSFAPWLPAGWTGFSFQFVFLGNTVRVDVSVEKVTYQLVRGEHLEFEHRGKSVSLRSGASVQFPTVPPVEAVLFDLDGVITDTAEFHFRAWGRLAKELKIDFDASYNEQLKGIGRMESLELLLKRSKAKYSEVEKKEMAERKNGYYTEMLAELSPKDVLPGIESLLTGLKDQGVKTVICSASKNARLVLERLGLLHRFDFIVDAAKVGFGKPDPEVFLAGCDSVGVLPESCVGIEDAASGVTAVRKAGIFAIGVGSVESLGEADVVVASTDRLSARFVLSRGTEA